MDHPELLRKFAANAATAEELDAFRAALRSLSLQEAEKLMDQYAELLGEMADCGPVEERLLQDMRQRIHAWEAQTAHRSVAVRKPFLRRWGWAAAVLAALSIGYFLFVPARHGQADAGMTAAAITPGKEGAVLTLADGTTVVLDSLDNGLIATEAGARVLLDNGRLAYEQNRETGSTPSWNTMTTPRGRQFRLLLPDGTKVWLNAASSIRYPVVFSGKEREVAISGEAYFEVAAIPGQPFRVKAGNALVEVLGTSFNINAYDNEHSLRTSLLQGSVRVSATDAAGPGPALVLQPGQQAALDEKLRLITGVDMTKVMAWKNGLFNFENASLEELMRQVERWYDIDVVYEEGIPKAEFFGKISKENNLEELLHILERSKIHFRMEGRKLIVLP